MYKIRCDTEEKAWPRHIAVVVLLRKKSKRAACLQGVRRSRSEIHRVVKLVSLCRPEEQTASAERERRASVTIRRWQPRILNAMLLGNLPPLTPNVTNIKSRARHPSPRERERLQIPLDRDVRCSLRIFEVDSLGHTRKLRSSGDKIKIYLRTRLPFHGILIYFQLPTLLEIYRLNWENFHWTAIYLFLISQNYKNYIIKFFCCDDSFSWLFTM